MRLGLDRRVDRRGAGTVLTTAAAVMLVAGLTVVGAALSGALTTASNDPLLPQQWALTQADVPGSWAISTGAGVTIGIVDTGVDMAHRELAAKIPAGGAANCLNTGGDPLRCTTGPGAGQDDNGHGTFVAGEAAAETNNAFQIAAAAPAARLVVAKVMDANGQGAISDINAGIAWVIAHGAQVINLSLGPDTGILGGGGQALAPGLEYAWSHNAVPVIASGNTNILGLFGGSGYGTTNAVVVGATGRGGQVASYSSPLAGTKWAVLAPGGDGPNCNQANAGNCVLSTYWVRGQRDADAYAQGTSMATPMVSGVVAQLLGMGLTQQQAVDTLLSSAVSKPGCGCAGEIDAAAAVRAALADGGHPDLVAPTSASVAQAPAPPRAVTTGRTPAAPASSSPSVTGAPSKTVRNTPSLAPSTTAPPPPVVVGSGGRKQDALPSVKSHPANATRTAARTVGVIMLLAVIAAAVWFAVLEPAARNQISGSTRSGSG